MGKTKSQEPVAGRVLPGSERETGYAAVRQQNPRLNRPEGGAFGTLPSLGDQSRVKPEEMAPLYDRKVAIAHIRKWVRAECDDSVKLPGNGLRINGVHRTHGHFVLFNKFNGKVRVSILDDIEPWREYMPDEVEIDYNYERPKAANRDLIEVVDNVEEVIGVSEEDIDEAEAEQVPDEKARKVAELQKKLEASTKV